MTEPQTANNGVSSMVDASEKGKSINDIGTGHEVSASGNLVQAVNSSDDDATSKPSITRLEMSIIKSEKSSNPQETTTSEDDDHNKKESNVKATTTADINLADRKNSETNVGAETQNSLHSKIENNNAIENEETQVKNTIVTASDVDIKNKETNSLQSPPELKNTLPTTNINDQTIPKVQINDPSKPAEGLRAHQNDKDFEKNQIDPAPTNNDESVKLSNVKSNPIDKTSNDSSSSPNIVNTANIVKTTNLPVVDSKLHKEQQENKQANIIAGVNEKLTDKTALSLQKEMKTTRVEVDSQSNTGGKVSEDIKRSDSGLLNKNVKPNEGENEVNVQEDITPIIIDPKNNEMITNGEENKNPAIVVNNPKDFNINDDKPELKGDRSKPFAQEVNKLNELNLKDKKVSSADNKNTEVAPPADNKPVLNDKISKPIVDTKNDPKPEDNGMKEKIIDDKNESEKKENTPTDELPNPLNNQPEVGSSPLMNAEEKDNKTNDATISDPEKNLNGDNKNDKVEKQSKDNKSALNAPANVQGSKLNETENPESISKKETNSTESMVEKKKDGFFTSIWNYFKKTEDDGSKSSEFDPLKLCIAILTIIVLVALFGIVLINFLVKKSE